MTAATALLVTNDDALLDDVLRLAAASGVILDVAHESSAALRSWSTASVVLVGADQAPRLADRQPVRRDQVHVVGHAPIPDDLFRAAVGLGAQHVAELPASETWLVELLTDVGDGGAGSGVMVGVVGGSGGIGATTFAAALAMTAADDGRQTLLVDADPLGGGIDRVIGYDDIDGIRWDSLTQASGRYSSKSLRESLPRRGRLAVLSRATGDTRTLDPFTVREVLSAAQRGSDVVVVDLPRYPEPAALEALQRCEHTVLVTGLTVPAVAATSRAVVHLQQSARRLHLVARGGAAALDAADVAQMLGVPLVATMSDQRRLEEAVDLGLGPVRSRRGPLARAARAVLGGLAPAAARAA